MNTLSERFIDLCIQNQVLQFGEFTLKSGRISPYFFNAGLFQDGGSIAQLTELYADLIVHNNLSFDGLFGPAYKGIPLVIGVATALYKKYQINKPYAFNRKEAKDHGEGGHLIGAPLQGKVLVIDDVITAGTAIKQTQQLLTQAGATMAGVVVALDRQERGQSGTLSSIQALQQTAQIPVYTLAKLDDIIRYLETLPEHATTLKAIQDYRLEYGAQPLTTVSPEHTFDINP